MRYSTSTRLRSGDAATLGVGYDPKLDYNFLTLASGDDFVFTNLTDLPDGRMGMSLLEIKQVMRRFLPGGADLPPATWLEMDTAWREQHEIHVERSFDRRAEWCAGPLPYLLTIQPDGTFTMDALDAEATGHNPDIYLAQLLRERLRYPPERIWAKHFWRDAPCRGYLTWSQAGAAYLPENRVAQKVFKYQQQLGGPICVAMHYDYRFSDGVWGPDEVGG